MLSHLDPADFAKALLLESSDIPADMTLAQWRSQKRSVAIRQRRRRRKTRPLLRLRAR